MRVKMRIRGTLQAVSYIDIDEEVEFETEESSPNDLRPGDLLAYATAHVENEITLASRGQTEVDWEVGPEGDENEAVIYTDEEES